MATLADLKTPLTKRWTVFQLIATIIRKTTKPNVRCYTFTIFCIIAADLLNNRCLIKRDTMILMFLKGHLNDLLRNAFRMLIVFLSSSFITELTGQSLAF